MFGIMNDHVDIEFSRSCDLPMLVVDGCAGKPVFCFFAGDSETGPGLCRLPWLPDPPPSACVMHTPGIHQLRLYYVGPCHVAICSACSNDVNSDTLWFSMNLQDSGAIRDADAKWAKNQLLHCTALHCTALLHLGPKEQGLIS